MTERISDEWLRERHRRQSGEKNWIALSLLECDLIVAELIERRAADKKTPQPELSGIELREAVAKAAGLHQLGSMLKTDVVIVDDNDGASVINFRPDEKPGHLAYAWACRPIPEAVLYIHQDKIEAWVQMDDEQYRMEADDLETACRLFVQAHSEIPTHQ